MICTLLIIRVQRSSGNWVGLLILFLPSFSRNKNRVYTFLRTQSACSKVPEKNDHKRVGISNAVECT